MSGSSVKLVMTWNIRPNSESEYSEFVVNEFIPRLNRLGLLDLEFWYTRYGECDQIQASGICASMEQMDNLFASEEWENLSAMLLEYVEDYQQKIIRATRGFQL